MPPIDVTFNSGERLSRGQRSRARVPQDGGQQVRTQVIAKTPSAGSAEAARAQAFQGLSRALTAGFGNVRAQEAARHEQAMRGINERNRLASLEAKRFTPRQLEAALKNSQPPPGVSSEFFDTRAFHDTAREIIGEHTGRTMALDEAIVAEISTAQDPYAARQAILERELKGAEGITAVSATSAFNAATEKMVATRKLQVVHEAVDDQLALVVETYTTEPPQSLEDYHRMRGVLTRTAAPAGSAKITSAIADMDEWLAEKAIEGDPTALELVHARDEDGVSLAMRIGDERWDEIEAEVQRAVADPLSTQQVQSTNLARAELSKGNLSGAWDIITKLQENPRVFETDLHRDLLREFARVAGDAQTKSSWLQMMRAGNYALTDDDDTGAFVEDYILTEPGALMEQGVDPEQAFAQVGAGLTGVADSIPQDAKNRMSRMLFQEETAPHIGRILSSMPEAAQAEVLTDEAYTFWRSLRYFGNDYQAAMEARRDRQKNPPTFQRKDTLRDLHGITAANDRREAYRAVAEGAVEANPNIDTGLFDFTGVDVEGVDREIITEAQEILNDVLFYNPTLSVEQGQEISQQLLAKRLVLRWDDNGDAFMRLRDPGADPGRYDLTGDMGAAASAYLMGDGSDLVVSGGSSRSRASALLGEVVGRNPTPEQLDRLAAQGFTVTAPAPVRFTGKVQADEITAEGGGYQVNLEIDGPEGTYTRQPIYEIGQPEWMPPDAAGIAWQDWDVLEQQPEDRPPGVPADWVLALPPEEQILVGDQMAWVPHDGMIELRYIGPNRIAETQRNMVETRKMYSGQDPAADPMATNDRRHFRAEAGNQIVRDMPTTGLTETEARRLRQRRPESGAQISAALQDARAEADQNKLYMVQPDTPEGHRFLEQADTFLTSLEGNIPYVYDDAVGGRRAWRTGMPLKGKRTIGKGYNMDRGDWPEVARDVIGLSPSEAKAVKNGERQLEPSELLALNQFLLRDVAQRTWEFYRDFDPPLPRSFMIARMSLWHHGVEGSESRDLNAALRAGDYERALEVWQENYLHPFRGTAKERAIRARRRKEASLAFGTG